MKSIKEKQLLVKWSKAMNEPIDADLLEEVERFNSLQNDVLESVRKNTISDLIEAQQVAEELVTKINLDYPKPPTLEELMSIVQEEANELVQTQPKQISVTEETPTPTPKPAKTLAEKAVQHITNEVKLEEKADSFQQPNPKSVDKNLDAVQKKLKFLEQAIGRIAATGPGGGAVNLKDLDDVDYASVVNATNNQVLTYNAAANLWISKTFTGGSGIALTDLSVVVNSANGNGNLSYDNNIGVFSFTPANVASSGSSTDTLNTVTNRGNVTTNGITVSSANANYFAVNTTAGYAVTTGQIAWNAADLTFDMGMANGVTLQVGQEQYIKIKAANAITDGYTVMFAGANGEHILGTHCDINSPGFRPEYFIGVATQSIAKNGFGYVTTFGKVHNVNTLAFQEGDILFASPTTIGQFTTTEPLAPNVNIMVAAVTKRAGGDGHLLVRPTLRSDLHQLNDVLITSELDGQSIIHVGGNIWKNAFITTANTIEQGNLFYTNARVYANVITLGYAANTYVNTRLLTKANVADLTTANVSEVTNLYFTNARAYSNVTQLGYYSNSTVITNNNTITCNAATAFIAGPAAISGVALQIPHEGGIRNLYNGDNSMYFDVSVGGSTQGHFEFRGSNAFTRYALIDNSGINAISSYRGKLPWNSAIDTELTVDDYRFRINTTAGNTYAQVISNTGGTKNSAWTAVAAISGSAVSQGGSTGVLVPNNSWTSLYTFGSMNSAGDTVTATFQDKNLGRIYRITFMRGDNGTTAGYNIVVERIL